jgi:hypothetical protein
VHCNPHNIAARFLDRNPSAILWKETPSVSGGIGHEARYQESGKKSVVQSPREHHSEARRIPRRALNQIVGTVG